MPPVKLGTFGDSGAGKTLTSTLIAIGLSKRLHNGAGICIADGEDAAKFVKPICDIEDVPLFVVPSHSFIDMRDGLKEAEGHGCCAYIVDNYTAAHKELTESAKASWGLEGRQMPYPLREELDAHWGEWVRSFRANSLHVLLNGRLGYTWDEVADDAGDPRFVKLDTKMRGERDMGYEPDLLIELEAIRTSLVRDKRTKTKSGKMKHAAVILKDRWRELNGKTFLWDDINDYKPGQYEKILKDFWPHIEKQAGVSGSPVLARQGAARSSRSLFQKPSGESAFAERQKRVTILTEEIHGTLNMIWNGMTADERKFRNIVLHTMFDTYSHAKIESLTPEALESGLRAIQLFAEAAQDSENNIKSEATVIALSADCKRLQAEQREAAIL